MILFLLKIINEKIIKYVLLAIVAMISFFSIRRSGINSERNNNLKANSDATKKSNDVRVNIIKLSDGAINSKLHKDWSRD